MPRVCNRSGCGIELRNPDGSPSYRKHFCGRECLNADNREKKQAMRARVPGKKCSKCGQRLTQNAGVCADATPRRELTPQEIRIVQDAMDLG